MREQPYMPSSDVVGVADLSTENSHYRCEKAAKQKPIGVATYRMVKRLPKELKGELPTPAEIAKLLEDGE